MSTIETYRADPLALRQAWNDIQSGKPMRARDAAEFLGVSECELVASNVADNAVRLQNEWLDILKRVTALGKVMALTRNDSTVHERKGVYGNLSATGKMGLALGDDIDLRLFFSQWFYGYGVTESGDSGTKRSLQFFNASGEAVHKIFLTEHSDAGEFDLLVEQFRAEDQNPGQQVSAAEPPPDENADAEIDLPGFHKAWANLKDTHEFFGLLREFKLKRTQALRLAEAQYAYPVQVSAARQMLEDAAKSGLAIMCFVGSTGCIQIHTGPVENIKVMGPWLNVLDPDFNLHLREDKIDQAWVVKKPTSEGIVTSLELFDNAGSQMAQFFGKRKPGIPELPAWRELVDRLPTSAAERQVA